MTDIKITLQSKIVARSDMLASQLSDQEMVMMDIDTGSYFGLENVGHAIWNHLDQPRLVSELCNHVSSEFDIKGEKSKVEQDVIQFLESMLSENLIHVDTSAKILS